jgi:uncharacterized protein with HEPN domain
MKHPERRLRHYLGDVLRALERIEQYVQDMKGDDFLISDLVQDAVVRNFEVIGEASKHILQRFPDFVAAHPELPLIQAYEMRNFVTHGYQQVDYEIVRKTICDDLPVLSKQVGTCLNELPNAND